MYVLSSYDIRNFTGFCVKVNGLIIFIQQEIERVKSESYNGQLDISFNIPELECVFEFMRPTSDIMNCGIKHIISDAHRIVNIEQLRMKSTVFNNIFKLKHVSIYEKLVADVLTENTLAIHLRGTDKDTEIAKLSDDKVVLDIKHFLDSHSEIDRIFLATDDEYYQKLIFDNFDNIVSMDCVRSSDGLPIHLEGKHSDDTLYSQVLTDCYMISKCKYFMYCFSNVSFLAMTMGINNFSAIHCFNS
jgi:hypothetical protein